MPNQCMKCSKLYPDGSKELLEGCNCGSKFFFFIKKDIEKVQEMTQNLTDEDKVKMEKEVLELIGEESEDENQPVFLNLETIRVLEPGKYQIGLRDIFKGKPLVYKLDDGKYIIDIASTFAQKNIVTPEEKKENKEKNVY